VRTITDADCGAPTVRWDAGPQFGELLARKVYNYSGMDSRDFRESLAAGRPPRGLPGPLRALWHAARGNWNRAHDIVAAQDGRAAARVHAYLHRRQGDIVNADYWYYRAGAKRPRGALDKEWRTLVQQFLQRQ
jgi:hypothetical protein